MAKTKRNILLAIILVLILVVIALLIGRFTYSYLAAQTSEDLKNEGETTASGDTIIFSKGNDLSISATTDNFNATSGNLTDTTNPSVRLVASSKTNEATATYYAGIKINKNTYTYSGSEAELILTVRDETGQILTTSADTLDYVTVNGISGFDITGKTGAFNIVKEHVISTNSSTTGTTHTWTFTLTFVNLDIDQSINENAELSMDVVLQKDEINMGKFTDYIINNIYTQDGENGLYYHDGIGTYINADQEAGDNSYRYSGSNPNNYVCFGSDAATCPANNLYRIIGLFDDDNDGVYNVKLIKSTTNGRAIWDGTYDEHSNLWSADIKPDIYYTLNTDFWNTLTSQWQSKIDATYQWKVGGMTWNTSYTIKQYYDVEVGTNQNGYVETMAIGLMYVNDYGYASSPEKWLESIGDPNVENYGETDWLFSDKLEWLLTRTSDSSNLAFILYSDMGGTIDGYNSVYADYDIRPTFYLKNDVMLNGGTGTETNPYRISL